MEAEEGELLSCSILNEGTRLSKLHTTRLLRGILYSGNFLRERIGEKCDFHGESFCRLLTFAMSKDATPPNFTVKTSANSHKTAKFVKVFSLECFPIYSMYIKNSAAPITPSLLQKYERHVHR